MTRYGFLIIVLAVLLIAVGVITFTDFKLSNEQYDRIKAVVLKWPGILTFLGVIVSTFKVPFGEETLTLVAAIGTFLAYCLGISSKVYDGEEND